MLYADNFTKEYNNSFVNFHGKNGSHNMNVLYPNPCYNEVCYKGTAIYYNLNTCLAECSETDDQMVASWSLTTSRVTVLCL